MWRAYALPVTTLSDQLDGIQAWFVSSCSFLPRLKGPSERAQEALQLTRLSGRLTAIRRRDCFGVGFRLRLWLGRFRRRRFCRGRFRLLRFVIGGVRSGRRILRRIDCPAKWNRLRSASGYTARRPARLGGRRRGRWLRRLLWRVHRGRRRGRNDGSGVYRVCVRGLRAAAASGDCAANHSRQREQSESHTL